MVESSGRFDTLPAVSNDPVTVSSPSADAIGRSGAAWFGLSRLEVLAMLSTSAFALILSYRGWWSISVTEACGFVTGGVCVWLVVREHLWNWPIGLANNAAFFFLFLNGRLFADMGLQVVYFGLGIYGWLNWLLGGKNRSHLRITRTTNFEWAILTVAIPLATWGLREILMVLKGASPFWDSLTTVLSLAAQYLLCRKRLENWFFWIAADLIYVPLYLSRSLPLTAVLYAVFMAMCLFGVREWNRSLKEGSSAL